jgi:hypothetical protein
MADPSVIERQPEPRSRLRESIVCEFCECTLSLRGRMIKRSDKAKAILDLDDEADRLRKENERLTAALAEATKTPEPPAPAPAKRKWASIGDDEDE